MERSRFCMNQEGVPVAPEECGGGDTILSLPCNTHMCAGTIVQYMSSLSTCLINLIFWPFYSLANIGFIFWAIKLLAVLCLRDEGSTWQKITDSHDKSLALSSDEFKRSKRKGEEGQPQSRIEIKVNMIWCWWVVLYERGSMLHGVAS